MKSHFTIPSSIEKRLQVWTDWAERQGHQQHVARPCLTISREYGCQAYKLAEAIYQRFGEHAPKNEEWTMLDRYLIEKIASESGYSKSELNYMTQSNPTIQSVLANLTGPGSANPSKVFTSTKETIRYFARTGNCIIIGRGGACLTQGFPNVIHVRLVAPMAFKIDHIMKSMDLPREQAKALIIARQDERNAFIKHFTNMDNSDPSLYHLVIDNEKSSIEEIAEMLYTRTMALIDV